jgi:diaminopimelate epimerase
MTPIDPDHVTFVKMSGNGNDFILIDHRSGGLDESKLEALVAGICRRRFSIGADGVILVEFSQTADFRWRFFNADGSRAEMCGNGARCVARYAHRLGVCGPNLSFETEAGLVRAQVKGRCVTIRLTDPHSLRLQVPVHLTDQTITVDSVNTGVPHVVAISSDIDQIDLPKLGREIRFHPHFAPEGTNVNFICREVSGGGIRIRTYERGVEGETLACGTGAVAGALIAAARFGMTPPVRVVTRSGDALTVFFANSAGRFHDIRQEGEARFIYSGVLDVEAIL